MKKVIIGIGMCCLLTLTFMQSVSAWTAVFSGVGTEKQFSKNVTGNVYQSIVALRKNTDPEMRIRMIASKQVGSNYEQMGDGLSCPIRQGTGIINEGCYLYKPNSGTATILGNWKQTTSGEMNSSLDITNYKPQV